VRDIEIGRLWRFVFEAKTHLKATAAPPTGTDVSGIYQFSSLGCVGITGFGARVKSAQVAPYRGDLATIVEIIEPQGYSANDTGPELRGSRGEGKDDLWRYGVMKFISTDGTTGVPVSGTTYFTPAPSGSSAESGLTGRRCKKVDQDWDTVPGLCISTAHFIGATSYAAGDGPEIKGSRRESRDRYGRKTGEMLFLTATATAAALPVPGVTRFTTLDGTAESTIDGRFCYNLVQDGTTIPGAIFTRAEFVAVKSGGYVGGSIPTSGSTLDKYLVSQPENVYVDSGASQRWVLRFEIPAATYSSSLLPAKSSGPSDEIKALTSPAVDGVLITRSVDFKSLPAVVVVTLIYGWSGVFYFDPLTRVSCRQVTVREKRKWSIDATPKALDGPVMTDADSRETQRYAIDGEEYEDVTYVQINISSIVSSIPDGWQSANFNSRNQAAVTIRGVTYATGYVLYTGGASEDVPASQSPRGTAAYKLQIVLLAAPKPWPLTVNRYIETLESVVVDVVNAGVARGENRVVKWVRAAAALDTAAIRAEFDMAAAIASLPS
jgi:hypothetical protein